MARPSKYDPAMIKKVGEYLSTCSREQTKLPKRIDVALLLGVDDETLIEWGKKHPEFSATLKRVDAMQMSQLIDDGIYGTGQVSAAMCIFLLKANHGLIETDRLRLEGENVMINLPKRYETNGLSGISEASAQTA